MPGLLRGVARTAVIAGTATAVSNRVSRRQSGRWASEDQAAQYEEAGPGSDVAPAGYEDRIALLRQLGELKEQGVLTETEFEQEKKRILGG